MEIEAAQWLAAYLADHSPVMRSDAVTAAREAGHSERSTDRVARSLDVQSERLPGNGNRTTWSLPEVERATEQATQGAALWLIDYLDAHGPTPRQDVLTAAPYSNAATLAGATLIDLDPKADVWEMP